MSTKHTQYRWEHQSSLLAIAALAIFLFSTVDGWGKGRPHPHPKFIEFSVTQLFLEENDTDGDLGVHFKVDGEPWNRVVLFGPGWQKLVDVQVKGNSKVIGLTELFNESAEPSFEDLPREDFLALFPEGEYKFYGRSIEGDWMGGLAELSHVMPNAPVVVSPGEEEEVDASEPLVVEWEIEPNEANIVNVIVVVEKDEDDERVRVLSADMRPEDSTLTVAPGFLEEGKAYKIEILVEEESGNKIITESEFETEGGDEEEEE